MLIETLWSLKVLYVVNSRSTCIESLLSLQLDSISQVNSVKIQIHIRKSFISRKYHLILNSNEISLFISILHFLEYIRFLWDIMLHVDQWIQVFEALDQCTYIIMFPHNKVTVGKLGLKLIPVQFNRVSVRDLSRQRRNIRMCSFSLFTNRIFQKD